MTRLAVAVLAFGPRFAVIVPILEVGTVTTIRARIAFELRARRMRNLRCRGQLLEHRTGFKFRLAIQIGQEACNGLLLQFHKGLALLYADRANIVLGQIAGLADHWQVCPGFGTGIVAAGNREPDAGAKGCARFLRFACIHSVQFFGGEWRSWYRRR